MCCRHLGFAVFHFRCVSQSIPVAIVDVWLSAKSIADLNRWSWRERDDATSFSETCDAALTDNPGNDNGSDSARLCLCIRAQAVWLSVFVRMRSFNNENEIKICEKPREFCERRKRKNITYSQKKTTANKTQSASTSKESWRSEINENRKKSFRNTLILLVFVFILRQYFQPSSFV